MTKKIIGRPSLGITRKLSLTLDDDMWKWLDKQADGNRSAFIRRLIHSEHAAMHGRIIDEWESRCVE